MRRSRLILYVAAAVAVFALGGCFENGTTVARALLADFGCSKNADTGEVVCWFDYAPDFAVIESAYKPNPE